HTIVLDASNGKTLFDFVRRFLRGAADVDGDGKAELFLSETHGVLAPAFGKIELVKLQPGSPSVKWSAQNAGWACADLPRLEPTWSTSASQGMREVLLARDAADKRPAFLVAQRDARAEAPFPTTVRAMRIAPNGELETVWQASGLVGDMQFVASSMDEKGGIGAS